MRRFAPTSIVGGDLVARLADFWVCCVFKASRPNRESKTQECRHPHSAFLQNRLLARPNHRDQLIASEFFTDDEEDAVRRRSQPLQAPPSPDQSQRYAIRHSELLISGLAACFAAPQRVPCTVGASGRTILTNLCYPATRMLATHVRIMVLQL
jgi:hypothetical protein